MKRRRSLFLHLNQLKQMIKKFALVILFLLALLLMILNKNNSLILENSTAPATSGVAYLVDILVVPAKMLGKAYDYVDELQKIKQDNRVLRAENRELKVLQNKYKALEIENKLLADLLNYVPLPNAGFISARVVAEENNAFTNAMVAYVGDNEITKGDVVLSDDGVVGRVDKLANEYAKIIMLTDINSKIPVIVEKNRVRGILTGDNTNFPKLIFVPLDAEINIGDRIVTSGVSGVFPAGLPVGQVVAVSKNEIKVKPFASLSKTEYVKIIKYGIADIVKQSENEK